MDLANLAESEFGSSKGEPQSMTNGSSSKSSDVPQMKQLQIRYAFSTNFNYRVATHVGKSG